MKKTRLKAQRAEESSDSFISHSSADSSKKGKPLKYTGIPVARRAVVLRSSPFPDQALKQKMRIQLLHALEKQIGGPINGGSDQDKNSQFGFKKLKLTEFLSKLC